MSNLPKKRGILTIMNEDSLGIAELEVMCGGKITKESIVFLIGPSEVNKKDFVYRWQVHMI